MLGNVTDHGWGMVVTLDSKGKKSMNVIRAAEIDEGSRITICLAY